jgi:hypothetical protein
MIPILALSSSALSDRLTADSDRLALSFLLLSSRTNDDNYDDDNDDNDNGINDDNDDGGYQWHS